MRALSQKYNPWRHGLRNFEHPPLENFAGVADGFFPLRVVLDFEIGEEIALYLRDQTPFVEDLEQLKPFTLMLKAGVGQNEFGPLCFFVFWVPDPTDPTEAFVAYDVYLNPHDPRQVLVWRLLAAQSHWHLFLIGAGDEQREFFEFENTFNLDAILDFALEAWGPIQLVDFNRAKSKFMLEHTVNDLLHLQ